MQLKSRHYDAPDISEAMELCYAKGWTDGLPVVPPTAERIAAMLKAAELEPDTQIAFIENRQVSVTAEKVAINSVLAGCKPEYMPVVVAAIEAIADPLYGYHGPATSTGGSAVFMVVNGPIARELDMNCGDNLFGPGWRANATIGRAVRLVMRNTIGTLPGVLDRSSLGHPGKYTFCIAENETLPTPPVSTADFGYLRLRREDYTEAQIKHWAKWTAQQKAQWSKAFAYFKHEERAIGPQFAQQMQAEWKRLDGA